MLDTVRKWLRSLHLWRCSSRPLFILANPFLRIDSNHSLDRRSEIFDIEVMEPGDDLLLLKREDLGRNINRFYHLSVEPTLLGGFAVRRTWGRLGTWGRTQLNLFADVSSARPISRSWPHKSTGAGIARNEAVACARSLIHGIFPGQITQSDVTRYPRPCICLDL